jgi:hypothetical protein
VIIFHHLRFPFQLFRSGVHKRFIQQFQRSLVIGDCLPHEIVLVADLKPGDRFWVFVLVTVSAGQTDHSRENDYDKSELNCAGFSHKETGQ